MTAALLNRRPAAASSLPPVGTGAPAATRQGNRPVLAVAYRWFARLLMAVAVVAFAGLAVGPHVLGYRTMTMLSGSMAPGINPGDVIIDTPVAVADVRVGMEISYHIPIDDHHVETHRVVSVEHAADGSVTVVTKGDANSAADPWKATLQGETVYQVRAVVPWIGKAITFLRTPGLSTALVYAVPALLAGWLILTIWRPEPAEAGTDGDTVDAPATTRTTATEGSRP
jgi:signal peptidase